MRLWLSLAIQHEKPAMTTISSTGNSANFGGVSAGANAQPLSDTQLFAMDAPANVETVLWRASSAAERRTLLDDQDNQPAAQPAKQEKYACEHAMRDAAFGAALDPVNWVATTLVGATTSSKAIKNAPFPTSRAVNIAKSGTRVGLMTNGIAFIGGAAKAYFTDAKCKK